jgi:chitinase
MPQRRFWFLIVIPLWACSAGNADSTSTAGAGGRAGSGSAAGAGGAGRNDAGTGANGGGGHSSRDAAVIDARADGTSDGEAIDGSDDARRQDAVIDRRDAASDGGSGATGSGGAGGDAGAGTGGASGGSGGAGGASGSGGAAGASGAGGTAGAGGAGGAAGAGGAGGASARHVIGYFAAWGVYARSYFVKNVESSGSASRLTHINYAFANISSDLKCAIGDSYADYDMAYDTTKSIDGVADTWDPGVLRGSFNQLKKLKAKYPHLKIMISLGGWTWSDKFSDAALTTESRRTLVKSCVDMYIKGAFAAGLVHPGIFDGIDVDWEYPGAPGNSNNYRPEDTANFTALLTEFRSALDAQGAVDGKRYWLTIAAPAGKDKFAKIEIGKIHTALDAVNLMTYDMHGAWETLTNFHAPLMAGDADPTRALEYDVDHAVQGWLAGGTPAQKLVVGLPFYGRGWKGVPAGPAGDGLYQMATAGGAQGTYEAGIEDYKVLKALETTYKTFRHPATRAFWIFEPTSGVFWSYDDPTALREKTNYLRDKALGGAMLWELSGDDSAGSLITAVAEGLK